MSVSDISDPNVRFSESCLERLAKAVAIGAGSGVFLGYSMLMWYPDPFRYAHKGTELPFNITLSYIARSLKAPVTWGALVCATFSLTECVVEQMRDEHKESTYVNASIAGAATGAVMASMTRRIDYMASSAFGTGILMGMVEYYGPYYQAKSFQLQHIEKNWMPTIAPGENESDIVKGLKEKYPKYKDL